MLTRRGPRTVLLPVCFCKCVGVCACMRVCPRQSLHACVRTHQWSARTSAQPCRPMRVGCTQSKVSMPGLSRLYVCVFVWEGREFLETKSCAHDILSIHTCLAARRGRCHGRPRCPAGGWDGPCVRERRSGQRLRTCGFKGVC